MTKPRVFIGASRENQDVAEAIQQSLDHVAEVEVWDQGTFGPSQYPLESLEIRLDTADFAIFVFSPDDVTMMRGVEKNTVRDNVVFELGLFIGRLTRRRTFIFSPRNSSLHLPTDLAGLTPLDYDADRGDGNLRAGLGSACTSVRAAIRAHGALLRPSRELTAQEADPSPERDHLPSDYYRPDETWDLKRYIHVYMVAVLVGRHEEMIAIDAAYRASSLVRGPEDLAVWDAACDWVYVSKGESRGIERFRDKVERYPNNPLLRDYLGRVLNHYGESVGAKGEFDSAARLSNDIDFVSAVITRATNTSDQQQTTIDVRSYRQLLVTTAGAEVIRVPAALSAMRLLAEKEELEFVSRGIDELRIRSKPDDVGLRFDVAHRYGEDGQSALAMQHYLAIPHRERNGTVWNNLGVAFALLGMPGQAVNAYLIASEKGETIADGNLAQKLLSAGFLDQAKARAEAAVRIEGHHENVVSVLAAIQTTKAEEVTKEADAVAAAKLQQEFLVRLGLAALSPVEADIAGFWETQDGPIEMRRQADGSWFGKAEIEVDPPAALGIMFSPVRTKQTVDIEYHFKRFGNALEGTVRRDTRGQRPSVLGLGLSPRELQVVAQEDGNRLTVRESAPEPSTSVWTRMSMLGRSSTVDIEATE